MTFYDVLFIVRAGSFIVFELFIYVIDGSAAILRQELHLQSGVGVSPIEWQECRCFYYTTLQRLFTNVHRRWFPRSMVDDDALPLLSTSVLSTLKGPAEFHAYFVTERESASVRSHSTYIHRGVHLLLAVSAYGCPYNV